MKAVYEVISGPAGAPRDWVRFKSLFADGARLIPVRSTGPAVMTPDEYAQRATPNFEKNAFYETELSRRTESFGNIAHAFSTYNRATPPAINRSPAASTAFNWSKSATPGKS